MCMCYLDEMDGETKTKKTHSNCQLNGFAYDIEGAAIDDEIADFQFNDDQAFKFFLDIEQQVQNMQIANNG